MKKKFWIPAIMVAIFLTVLSVECTKKDPVIIPEITTSPITNIAATQANSGGNITSDGGGAVKARGVCWSTDPDPTVALTTRTSDGAGTGIFTSCIIGLTSNTQYHVRSYASNSAGTAYGLDVTFTSSVTIVIPTLTTTAISSIGNTTATSGGNITSDGSGTIIARGVCWSTDQDPTIALATKTSDGVGTGLFTSNITGLSANTQYHVRSYATNSAGTSYGSDVSFTTSVIAVIPTITTAPVSSITSSTATSGGNITSEGSGAISARGVCWSTNPDPTVALTTKTSDGAGTGMFASSITGLASNTLYHVRAFATNPAGTTYGSDVTFTTSVTAEIPTITTAPVTSITCTTATSGGNITIEGSGAIVARGVCWSTNSNPTVDLTTKTSDGTGSGSYVSSITGLTAGVQYHIRSYATNSAGTAYGSDIIFSSAAIIMPTISTTTVSSITNTTATSGGNITSDGGGNITSRGVCWNLNPTPTILLATKTSEGTGIGNFSSNITALSPGTQYHIRSYATNSAGTAYGSELVFSTTIPILIPTITTTLVSQVTSITATTGGVITSDGGGAITAKGVCWSLNPDPTIDLPTKTSEGSGAGTFASSITGLAAFTVYYVRAYASNSAGTAYGLQLSFTTKGSVTDVEGNVYNTIIIGDQQWMAENLKTTKYNDGSDIPLKTNSDFWSYTTTVPGYCWYNNNDATNKNIYGGLYNWYTVNTGKICPAGWHIPSDDEWITLIMYVGGENTGGDKLKEAGNSHWSTPGTTATNDYGFTALPGGQRYSSFTNLGISGTFWSSTSFDFQNSFTVEMDYNYCGITRYIYQMSSGLSVRCLKD